MQSRAKQDLLERDTCPTVMLEAGSEMVWGCVSSKTAENLDLILGRFGQRAEPLNTEVKAANKFCYGRFLERKIWNPLVNVADRLKKLCHCYTTIYVIIKKIFIEIMNKKIRMLNHSQKFMSS